MTIFRPAAVQICELPQTAATAAAVPSKLRQLAAFRAPPFMGGRSGATGADVGLAKTAFLNRRRCGPADARFPLLQLK